MPHIKGIPRKLEVCGITYDIDCPEIIRGETGNIIFGLHSPTDGKIYISRECENMDVRKLVLLHEAIHGIDVFLNLDLDKGHDDERVLRPLATAIYELLKRNPGVWRF